MKPIRVVVADDHSLLREGIANLLRMTNQVEVIGEAGDGYEAIEQVQRLSPDVVLMDLGMPGMDGVAATRIIVQQYHQTSVVILTVSENDNDLLAAITAGAKGYLLKNSKVDDVVRAIGAAAVGDAFLSSPMAAKMLRHTREAYGGRTEDQLSRQDSSLYTDRPPIPLTTSSSDDIAGALGDAEGAIRTSSVLGASRIVDANSLTRRELQVLRLLVEGASTQAVAERLCISRATARHHIDNVMGKLGVHTRLEAVAYALRERIV